jgi:hypothetical protein
MGVPGQRFSKNQPSTPARWRIDAASTIVEINVATSRNLRASLDVLQP